MLLPLYRGKSEEGEMSSVLRRLGRASQSEIEAEPEEREGVSQEHEVGNATPGKGNDMKPRGLE